LINFSFSIFLPKGTWYSLFSNGKLDSKRDQNYQLLDSITDVQVYARGGSILFVRERIRRSLQLTRHDPYSMFIYLQPGESLFAEGFQYFDDGKTFDYQTKNERKLMKYKFQNDIISAEIVENGTYKDEYARLDVISIIGHPDQAKIKTVEVRMGSQTFQTEVIRYDLLNMMHIKKPPVDPLSDDWQIKIK